MYLVDDSHIKTENKSTLWISEEKMKIWQIDLYHRNTEDGGIHVERKHRVTENGLNLRDRTKIRAPARNQPGDESPDYTPDEKISQPRQSQRTYQQRTQYTSSDQDKDDRRTDWRKTTLQPINAPPNHANGRFQNQPRQVYRQIIRDPSGQIVSRPDSYSPYRPGTTPPPRQMPPKQPQRPTGPSATNVRITKAILESILHNPKQFTQINTDQPQHLCTFLKVKVKWNTHPTLSVVPLTNNIISLPTWKIQRIFLVVKTTKRQSTMR